MAVPDAPVVSRGGFLYLSGTLAEDDTGAILGKGDVGAQTRHVLERMRRLLEANGSSLDHVVAAMVYLTSASDFQAMNEAYRTFWPANPPARTTVITRLVVPDALIEMTMIAVPRGSERVVVHPETWLQSPNPYSYAVRAGDTVFLSGLVPRSGRDGSVFSGGIAVQTRAVMDNAGALLSAAGLSFADVVSSRVYLTGASDFRGMNEVYREYFTNAPPARATVVSGLAGPGFLVEMTFTASSSTVEAIGAPPTGIPISPAIRAGRRLYVSGALGNTPDTAGDVGAQTRETLVRLGRTLEAAGAERSDVVDATVYLTDVADFDAMNQQYMAFFGGTVPARATVGASLVVPDGLVEIALTAVLE